MQFYVIQDKISFIRFGFLNTKMDKIPLAVRIPASLQMKLDDYLHKTKVSKTDIVITALAQYLNSPESLSLNQRMDKLERRLAALETKVEVK